MSETIESKPEAQPWQLVDRDGERVEIGAVLTQQSSGPVERNFRMTGGSPPSELATVGRIEAKRVGSFEPPTQSLVGTYLPESFGCKWVKRSVASAPPEFTADAEAVFLKMLQAQLDDSVSAVNARIDAKIDMAVEAGRATSKDWVEEHVEYHIDEGLRHGLDSCLTDDEFDIHDWLEADEFASPDDLDSLRAELKPAIAKHLRELIEVGCLSIEMSD
jgi:hypothetical protein